MPSMVRMPRPKKKKLFTLYPRFEARYLQRQAEKEALAEEKRLKVRRRFEYDKQVSRNRFKSETGIEKHASRSNSKPRLEEAKSRNVSRAQPPSYSYLFSFYQHNIKYKAA